MKKLLLVALCGVALCSENKVLAQGAEKCASHSLLNNYLQKHPEYAPLVEHQRAHREAQDLAFRQNLITGKQQAKTTATVYTIPVVFHVLLTQAKLNNLGGTNGVRDRMISQLTAMNADYKGTNTDKVNVPSAFLPVFGEADIEFLPAHTSPTGQATEGFNIVTTTISSFAADGGSDGWGSACKHPAEGGVAAWDPMKYLNIWVVDVSGGNILGYCIPPSYTGYPGIELDEIGVVLDYGAFGKRVSPLQYFSPSVNDLGRTLTHEVGHFFELAHTFGDDAGCGNGDGIFDTPNQADATYSSSTSCPVFPKFDACTPAGNGIMWMNYMDYVDDRCMYMFTDGQVNMMRSQFNSGVIKSLSEHPELTWWPTDVAEIPGTDRFMIYPNPTSGQFDLQLGAGEDVKSIAVLNTLGQVVYSINAGNSRIDNYHIDLTHFSKGVYMVQCNFATGTVTRKIVLQ